MGSRGRFFGVSFLIWGDGLQIVSNKKTLQRHEYTKRLSNFENLFVTSRLRGKVFVNSLKVLLIPETSKKHREDVNVRVSSRTSRTSSSLRAFAAKSYSTHKEI